MTQRSGDVRAVLGGAEAALRRCLRGARALPGRRSGSGSARAPLRGNSGGAKHAGASRAPCEAGDADVAAWLEHRVRGRLAREAAHNRDPPARARRSAAENLLCTPDASPHGLLCDQPGENPLRHPYG